MRHHFGAFDVSFLAGFAATTQQHIDRSTAPDEINAVTLSMMNTHFRNAFTHRLAITKITKLSTDYPAQDMGFGNIVG